MASGTGNLPYPGKSYTPFDILTAEELNEDVANIESLATGAGIGDGAIGTSDLATAAVTSQKIDFTTLKSYIQSGSSAIVFQVAGSGGGAVSVVFPVPFTSTPIIVATPRDSNASIVSVHIPSVSSTGFSILGRTNAGGNISGSFNWIAHLQ